MNQTIMFFIFPTIAIIVGIILIIIGRKTKKGNDKKVCNCTSKTYGKVVDITEDIMHFPNEPTTTAYFPIFEYSVGNLKFVKQSTYSISKLTSDYKIGQKVEIYYNPQKPDEYYVDRDRNSKIYSKTCIEIGIGFIVISIIILAGYYANILFIK